MKTDLSFKLLTAAIIAGVITALAAPSQPAEPASGRNDTPAQAIAVTKN